MIMTSEWLAIGGNYLTRDSSYIINNLLSVDKNTIISVILLSMTNRVPHEHKNIQARPYFS